MDVTAHSSTGVKNFIRKIIDKTDPKHTKLLGVWTRSLHFMMPCVSLVCALAGPKWLVKVTIALFAMVVGLYLYLGGCILTWLEKKLCREDVNIADWLLVVLGHETCSNNRNVITLFFFPFYFMFVVFLYCYRFL